MGGSGKIAVAGLAAVLVVAMVIAIAITVSKKSHEAPEGSGGGGGGVNTSNKAANALCAGTDYQETCHKSIGNADSSDPKKLVEAALSYSVEHFGGVIKDSKAYKEAASDKGAKEALDICTELLNNAVGDLNRTMQNVQSYNAENSDKLIMELKTWMSAVGTYQTTCVDAFEKTPGDAGEKMKNLLKQTRELTSNGLAMLDEVKKFLGSLDLSALSNGRKLLDAEEGEEGETETGGTTDKDDFVGGLGMDDEIRRALYEFESPPSGTAAINAVVAPDGSAQFRTINDVLKTIPPMNNNTFVIFIKAGVYAEEVVIPRYMNKIVFRGEGATKTKITGSKNLVDGVKVFNTASCGVSGDDFVAKDIGFENTAGPAKQQAVALRITGDRAVLFNCNIDGFRSSLYAMAYRQYYRDCTISGSLDFVFGDALAIFQNCNFVAKPPLDIGSVSAQGRDMERSEGATVIVNSRITAAPDLAAPPPRGFFLGRPWKTMARTIIMRTEIGPFISPEGWTPGDGNIGMDTAFLVEFENKGPGADVSKRVPWKAIQKFDLPAAEAWTPLKAFRDDTWITASAVPYNPAWMP